jgi:hypothetical protein
VGTFQFDFLSHFGAIPGSRPKTTASGDSQSGGGRDGNTSWNCRLLLHMITTAGGRAGTYLWGETVLGEWNSSTKFFST